MTEPIKAIIPADALDVSGLPPHARTLGTEAFKLAVSKMLAGDLQAFGLDGTITVTDDTITVFAATGVAADSVVFHWSATPRSSPHHVRNGTHSVVLVCSCKHDHSSNIEVAPNLIAINISPFSRV